MITLDEAAAQGDLDELIRWVDRLTDQRDWDELVRLRDKAKAAIDRGFQLWPAASYAEYRIALEAPGQWAGALLSEGAGWMALGPLHEVAASTHEWSDLAGHHPGGPHAYLAAHERVLRGEDLTDQLGALPQVFDLPAVLQPWEPEYALATYKPDKAEFPSPAASDLLPTRFGDPGKRIEDATVEVALVELAKIWADQSNGRLETAAVEGDAYAAVAALGVRAGNATVIDAKEALTHMAWTAASGGAHGRRRGSATGRARAWWALTTLAGLEDADRLDPTVLGEAANELTWLLWDAGEPETGWHLRLAVADDQDGLAWAINAQDAATE